MTERAEIPVLTFASPREWERWLEKHYTDPNGIWLKFARVGVGIASINHAEALDPAICFGWIDGQTRSIDPQYWMQRFAPRRPRSKWSKVNCAKALQFIKAGAMRPAGLAEVERAQADGRWAAAYDAPSAAKVPPDLQAAFDKHPQAAKFFAELDGRNRYAILHRLQDAKKPETRVRRLAKFVAMLEAGEKIH